MLQYMYKITGAIFQFKFTAEKKKTIIGLQLQFVIRYWQWDMSSESEFSYCYCNNNNKIKPSIFDWYIDK